MCLFWRQISGGGDKGVVGIDAKGADTVFDHGSLDVLMLATQLHEQGDECTWYTRDLHIG